MNEIQRVSQSIGDIIREKNQLSPTDVENVIEYQRKNKVKFGEAAVSLGLVKREDVIWALSHQFHYPYAHDSHANISQELIVASNPFSPEAEIFRDLRSQLLDTVFTKDELRPILAIISPRPQDGKSFFAANLAVSFSQLGGRTLLVDADMRTPRQHQIFNVDSGSGLSSILSGRTEVNVLRPIEELPNLYLLPVGTTPPNPLELVQKPAFGMLLAELSIKFDQIIVDTPAASHGADARVIASMCGHAMVVGRKNEARMTELKRLVEEATRAKIKLTGIAINEA